MGNDRKAPKPKLTPVTGKARGAQVVPGSENTEIPIGFEMLLYRAAEQPEFKERLLADRTAAVREAAIRLRPSEQTLLETVSDEALETMIGHIAPHNPRRRRLMGNVAAAVTSLAAGTAVVASVEGCEEEETGTRTGIISAGMTTTTTGGGMASMGITPAGSGGTAGQGGQGGDTGGGGSGGATGGGGAATGGGGTGGSGGD